MGPTGQTITVIDDDESIRRSLRRLIQSFGLGVECFASAAEFLESPGGGTACVILDVRMPDMTGLELQKRLASLGRCVPLIFITAHEDEQARREALEAGAVDFLQKPFDDCVLLDAVARALACAGGQKATREREGAMGNPPESGAGAAPAAEGKV